MAPFAPVMRKPALSAPARGPICTLPCTCHEVYMHCPACQARFALQEYISQADDAMEHFLENVYCDRV